jgi:hypothetical protein
MAEKELACLLAGGFIGAGYSQIIGGQIRFGATQCK